MPTKKQLEERIAELEGTKKILKELIEDMEERHQASKEVISILKGTISLLENLLKQKESGSKLIELIHKRNDKYKNALIKHYKKQSRKRESTKKHNTAIRDARMLQHFQELLSQEEAPSCYGVRGRLRRQTYDWAVEQKLFNSEKTGETRKKPLSDQQLAAILPMPKK